MRLLTPSSQKRRWLFGSGAGLAAGVLLSLLALGVPENDAGGCGGPVTEQLEDDVAVTCAARRPLVVHFYSVEQGLSAMVELPDGRHILVDTGAAAVAPGCGAAACQNAHEHLVEQLQHDLAGKPLDMIWITHQHMDHIGGAADLLSKFKVHAFVDNGRALAASDVAGAHKAAQAAGVPIVTIAPTQGLMPLKSTKALQIRPIVPKAWIGGCGSDENLCSIGLRIDYCQSSVLFVGDAEFQEEAQLDPLGHATMLQLGHHGSDTSSGPDFLAKVTPKIAVVSAGRPGFGMNRSYCHPRASTMKAVTDLLGGPGSKTLLAFDAQVPCTAAPPSHWPAVPVSDRLYATERDGDLTFVGTGTDDFTLRH
jgi:competence protein ComEC